MWAFSRLSQAFSKAKPSVVPVAPAERGSYFKHTSQRWLYNEDAQNACRYVEFDIEELQRVACEAVGAEGCTSFTKLKEGSYNKVYALVFENGMEAVARIPTKLAGPPFLVTASEVATSEFAREVLGIPTPRILAWNARAETSAVGTEYIIMEKAKGVDVYHRWIEMAGKTALPFFQDMYLIEKSFEQAPFASIGSLYFKEDVSPELQAEPLFDKARLPEGDLGIVRKLASASEKYRIGPIADRQWWRKERLGMPADRGPWRDLASFLQSTIQLERSWINEHAAANSTSLHRQGPHKDPSEHLRILDLYSQAIPRILPSSDMATPTLWHPDFSLNNIIVSTSGPATILSVIDWQHTIIAPYCMQATFPDVLAYNGSLIEYPPDPNVRATLPDNHAALPPDVQQACTIELKLACRQKLYERYIYAERGRRFDALTDPLSLLLAKLPHALARTWTDGPTELQHMLAQFQSVCSPGQWEGLRGAYFDLEISRQAEEHERETRYAAALDTLYYQLCCAGDGRVAPDMYDMVMKEVEVQRALWDDDANGGPFPLRDGMYSFYLN